MTDHLIKYGDEIQICQKLSRVRFCMMILGWRIEYLEDSFLLNCSHRAQQRCTAQLTDLIGARNVDVCSGLHSDLPRPKLWRGLVGCDAAFEHNPLKLGRPKMTKGAGLQGASATNRCKTPPGGFAW
jgi:hypothetical protein